MHLRIKKLIVFTTNGIKGGAREGREPPEKSLSDVYSAPANLGLEMQFDPPNLLKKKGKYGL